MSDNSKSLKEHYKYAISIIAKWPQWKKEAFKCEDIPEDKTDEE